MPLPSNQVVSGCAGWLWPVLICFLAGVSRALDAGTGLAITNSARSTITTDHLHDLSSGAIMLLDRGGDLARWPAPAPTTGMRPKVSADATINAGLDPRVGLNLRLGDDPPQLPTSQRAQAEPHIARDPNTPDTLAAVFQEGRYADAGGGAVDCGYSISHDGGLSWTRALIPELTQASGGPYYRATDPVAGIDLQGRMYLCTLAFADARQTIFPIVVSRSTNGGASFEAPFEVYRNPNGTLSPDKNWMAINTFPQSSTAGRIVVTWTMFENTSPFGSPIAYSVSDDAGQTWSAVRYATPTSYSCQGSQPVFLPDGTLAIVYWNFSSSLTGGAAIEVVTSSDGGGSFSSAQLVTPVTEYNAPGIRQGSFLPSATGDRTNGILAVTYQTLYQGRPKVMFTKSTNKGATWSAPVPASDNPTNAPIFNPGMSVSPDGQIVTIAFYDQRVNPANTNLVDLFLAQSFDGGASWQPNLRVTSVSSDVTVAPLTADGYMLGDYLAVAPTTSADVPAVPIWIDNRTGNPDPFIGRVGIAPQLDFSSWRAARFSLSQIGTPTVGGPGADPDADGIVNLLEYAFGLSPWIPDSPVFQAGFSGGTFTTFYERISGASDLNYSWLGSSDLSQWSPVAPSNVVVTPSANRRTETVTSVFAPATSAARFFRLAVERHN